MSRIRSIKPEFFTSEDMITLPAFGRLFYQALWCEADREGRLKWNLATLKYRYFPADDIDLEELTDLLIEGGQLKLYSVNDKDYAYLPNFKDHQVINNKEKDSILPEPSNFFDACKTRESGDLGERKGREGKGKEGKGIISNANALLVKIPDEILPGSEEEAPTPTNQTPNCPHKEIVELYHQTLPSLQRMREWHDTRQKYLKTRWCEKPERQSLEWWQKLFEYIAHSDFLMGRSDARGRNSPWQADLEWIIRPINFTKIIEGKYHK